MKNPQKVKFSRCICERCGKPFTSRKNNAKYGPCCKEIVIAERARLAKGTKKKEIKGKKYVEIPKNPISINSPISDPNKNLVAIIRDRVKNSREFLSKFEPKDRLLITLRDELYEGSWKSMQDDLDDRLESKPVIPKLTERIKYDLKVLEQFKVYEEENKVNLKEVI